MKNRLQGKAVVITGSGRGLGRAYAMAAAAEGASVVVNDVDGDTARETARAIRDAGHIAIANHDTVAEPNGAERIIASCVDEFGQIDGLINNAGTIVIAPAWELDPAQVRRLVDVNILGVIYCGLAAIHRFRAQGHGIIVNVTSGSHLGMDHLSIYGATKGAVASLTYGWARDLASEGIRVIGYSPLAPTHKYSDATSMSDPDRVALAIPYLLDKDSAGLSGQVVRFDGTHLSLLRPPAFAGPFFTRDEWSVDVVAEGFATTLRPTIGQVGMPPVDLSAGP